MPSLRNLYRRLHRACDATDLAAVVEVAARVASESRLLGIIGNEMTACDADNGSNQCRKEYSGE